MQLFSQISTVISHDWEIFAIEDLKLEKETVKEIIREYPEMSDQLSAALKHWVPSFSVETRSHLEKNILGMSEVYNYYRGHSSPNSRGGENNAASSTNKTEKAGSDEQYPQVTTFSELVKEVAKSVGDIGALRLSRQYRDLNLDTFTDSQITTLTGESFINLLQEKNLLTDDMESLGRLKEALDESLLLRASHLVDTFINEKGMFKKRFGIVTACGRKSNQ
ncbi:hypothetical protein HOLleu_22242 [Holothuria leucospilota]|uniref:Uncharacterized protein n=1 Tax=Holothuria leucospilota TaxID=206669 RepID=A0A9Q1BZ01_HOLLE|nr:hypothetical protein HOLleu_22242 [Holothuria leucospilota]